MIAAGHNFSGNPVPHILQMSVVLVGSTGSVSDCYDLDQQCQCFLVASTSNVSGSCGNQWLSSGVLHRHGWMGVLQVCVHRFVSGEPRSWAPVSCKRSAVIAVLSREM
jgi:hypothetical protein